MFVHTSITTMCSKMCWLSTELDKVTFCITMQVIFIRHRGRRDVSTFQTSLAGYSNLREWHNREVRFDHVEDCLVFELIVMSSRGLLALEPCRSYACEVPGRHTPTLPHIPSNRKHWLPECPASGLTSPSKNPPSLPHTHNRVLACAAAFSLTVGWIYCK